MASENSPAKPSAPNYKSKAWLGVAIALVVLFMAFIVGLAAGRWSWQNDSWHNHMGPGGGFHMMGGRDGGQFSNLDRLRGVVTAVNGSSFTIAGNGSTNTVNTNNSTQWQGGDSVKVNDSVVVFGTTANNTYTATEVVVNP